MEEELRAGTMRGERLRASVYEAVAPAKSALAHEAVWLPALSPSVVIWRLGGQGSVRRHLCMRSPLCWLGSMEKRLRWRAEAWQDAERILHVTNVFSNN